MPTCHPEPIWGPAPQAHGAIMNPERKIEVVSRRNASNALPVMWAIGELEIPYVRHDIGGSFGGTDTADYLAMNPNGRIPTIRDGDFVLWESNAIVRYLCRRYDESNILLPETDEGYVLVNQ